MDGMLVFLTLAVIASFTVLIIGLARSRRGWAVRRTTCPRWRS